jgi:hypothetical protein
MRVVDRREKLSRLLPGDIFHASCPNQEASLICIVEQVGRDRIEARRITTQDHVTFDSAGHTLSDDPSIRYSIDSIAPLPVDIHGVLLGLERKMRLRFDKLNRAEKDALLFVADFYPANQLEED